MKGGEGSVTRRVCVFYLLFFPPLPGPTVWSRLLKLYRRRMTMTLATGTQLTEAKTLVHTKLPVAMRMPR